jgi:hypothetical protein
VTYKVLGQSAPSATTATDLYTVPSGKSTVVSTVSACNRSTSAITYRISIRVAGAAAANAQYLAYDANLPPNSTDFITVGITLGAGDVITVYASSASASFSAFGNEA